MLEEQNGINEYKLVILLKYFKLVNASYSYNELMEIFGMNIKQINKFIDLVINKEYLKIEGFVKITKKGNDLLERYNMNNLDRINSEFEMDIFNGEKINFEDVYIPKNFAKKF